MDSVGSTSWHNRHQSALRGLCELLSSNGPETPTIMIIGPGGVSRVLAPMLNDSARPNASAMRKLLGDMARYADQLLRRVPVISLVSLEAIEVSSALTMPHRLVVVDRSRRVLAAVRRDLPLAVTHCVDISCEAIPEQADAVIAFNVVCRLDVELQLIGMRHVTNAVRPGGLLLVDDRSAQANPPGDGLFVPLGNKTHRRRTE